MIVDMASSARQSEAMSTSSIVRGAHDRSAPTRRRAVVLALTTASLLIAGCGDSSSAPWVVSSKVLADVHR